MLEKGDLKAGGNAQIRIGGQMSGDDFTPKKTHRTTPPADDVQSELQSVWDQLRQKDAQILVLQKKMSHFRSWVNSLQTKVNAQNPQALKNARRLYIGGFAQNTTEEDLKQFLSTLMKQTGGCVQPGNPVLSVKVMKDKNYAFAELRSVEEAANATAFDGVAFKDTNLKIKRPSNYDVNSAILLGPVTPDPTMDTSGLDICRSTVEDSPHKLFIGGLPYDHTEEQVRDLLATFGSMKSFNLVMDRNTGKSKGYAFCELMDESLTDYLIQQLNGKKIGNKSLTVKRAAEGSKAGSPLLSSMLGMGGAASLYSQPKPAPNFGMAAMSNFGFGAPVNTTPAGFLSQPLGATSSPTNMMTGMGLGVMQQPQSNPGMGMSSLGVSTVLQNAVKPLMQTTPMITAQQSSMLGMGVAGMQGTVPVSQPTIGMVSGPLNNGIALGNQPGMNGMANGGEKTGTTVNLGGLAGVMGLSNLQTSVNGGVAGSGTHVGMAGLDSVMNTGGLNIGMMSGGVKMDEGNAFNRLGGMFTAQGNNGALLGGMGHLGTMWAYRGLT